MKKVNNMLNKIKVDIYSAPPSKEEIDRKNKAALLYFKITASATVIFFLIASVCFISNSFNPNNWMFFALNSFFFLNILSLIFSCISVNVLLSLDSVIIKKDDEGFIGKMSPDSDIVKYLNAVKEQGRGLTRLELDAIKEFINKEKPKVQLNEIVSNFNKEKGE